VNPRYWHTPLTKSNISRIATQNSSKSRLPSLSTSAKSHIRSSWSSRNWLFFNTGAACAPVRCVPPFERDAKISQYFSISLCSMRLFDMLEGMLEAWDGSAATLRAWAVDVGLWLVCLVAQHRKGARQLRQAQEAQTSNESFNILLIQHYRGFYICQLR